MKRKELKSLAQKIAKYEHIIQNTDNKELQHQAEKEVMKLCSCVDSLEDMSIIDELVMDIMKKNS